MSFNARRSHVVGSVVYNGVTYNVQTAIFNGTGDGNIIAAPGAGFKTVILGFFACNYDAVDPINFEIEEDQGGTPVTLIPEFRITQGNVSLYQPVLTEASENVTVDYDMTSVAASDFNILVNYITAQA